MGAADIILGKWLLLVRSHSKSNESTGSLKLGRVLTPADPVVRKRN
jgi:hypothetical protein